MFDVPSAASIVSSSTEYSTTWFTEFLPFIWVAIGILGAVALVVFLRGRISGAISRVMGGRRGRGRRRR